MHLCNLLTRKQQNKDKFYVELQTTLNLKISDPLSEKLDCHPESSYWEQISVTLTLCRSNCVMLHNNGRLLLS